MGVLKTHRLKGTAIVAWGDTLKLIQESESEYSVCCVKKDGTTRYWIRGFTTYEEALDDYTERVEINRIVHSLNI